MYTYNEEFYQYINRGSRASAEVVLDVLLDLLPRNIESVLDVGCGAGAWLSVWKGKGAQVTGVDGKYVLESGLLIDTQEFIAHDLSQPIDLGKRFDLSQSLEVAEHLPHSAAEGFVASLCKSSDIVMFSAAAPGQGGENHINEQPYEYWQALFARNDFQMYDALRDRILAEKAVKPWYRFNTFVYVKNGCQMDVHAALAEYRLEAGQVPVDKSPKLYQLRKRLINAMPVKQRTQIAVLKKKMQIGMQRPPGSA